MTTTRIFMPDGGTVHAQYKESEGALGVDFRGKCECGCNGLCVKARVEFCAYLPADLRALANAFEAAASLLDKAAAQIEADSE